RRAQPPGQLLLAFGGDPEPLLRALPAGPVGLHEPVTLQPLQRRVHLTHVQPPDLARAGLEPPAPLPAVPGHLAQQREHRVADAHDLFILEIMLSSILSMLLSSNGIAPPHFRKGRLSCRGPRRRDLSLFLATPRYRRRAEHGYPRTPVSTGREG